MNTDEASEGSETVSWSSSLQTLAVSVSPPTLDECVHQSQLYYVFLRYLAGLKANENLVFVKRATIFSIVRLPPKSKYAAAVKIIWDFFSDSSPTPVNVSAETRNKLLSVLWRKDGITLVKDDMFDQAISEIRMLLEPMYNSWINTNEWQQIPFFHAQPPSIPIIIHLPSVRSNFETFLKGRRDSSTTRKTADLDVRIFEACVELQEIIDHSKAEGVSKKDAETAARRYIRAHKSALLSLPLISDLEMPSLQHKKRHAEGNKDDDGVSPSGDAPAHPEEEPESMPAGQPTCMDFVLDALDTLSVELSEHECYEHFVEEKSWNYIDVLKASLSQTIGKDGYVEYPTLAAILHAPTYGPLIMDTLKGTAKNDQMRFLLEAHQFHTRFSPKGQRKLNPQERKEMQIEARRISDAFISKNSVDVPKRVRSEILKIIHSPLGRISPDLFQIAGAWVYNVISCSWIREVNSMLLWADHDFDNNAPIVQDMQSHFNFSHLSHLLSENLQLVPHPDDVLGNAGLWDSFRKFVPANDFTNACFEFIRVARTVPTSPPEAQLTECQTLLDLLTTISKESPGIMNFKNEIESHMMQDTRMFNPAAFLMPSFFVTRMLFCQYYSQWTSKCKLAYKMNTWNPVKLLTFVSNNAIPGTSWIPSVQLTNNEVTSKAMPAKKRWGLMSKIRGGSSSDSSAPVPIDTNKKSSSVVSYPHSPVAPAKADPLSSREHKRSSSTNFSDSTESLGDVTESSQQQIRLPVNVQKSIPVFNLEVPTMVDTLASPHLRRLFYSTFLEPRLGDDEKLVWNALCKFQESFVGLTDSEIAERQKDIRDAAKKILMDNPRIPDQEELMQVLEKSSYPVSSKFFFGAEAKLYGQFHHSYQSFLVNNHWIMH